MDRTIMTCRLSRLCFSITLLATALILNHNLCAQDAPPPLTDDELYTPQQEALLKALGGDPYGHRAHDHACAGWATNVRCRAIPSNTWPYGGYMVGGGQALKGCFPGPADGTFGWDYFGIMFNKRIALNWSYWRYQGGTGAYKTDGPKIKHE